MTIFILLVMYIPFGYLMYRLGWVQGEEAGYEMGRTSNDSGV